MSRELVKLNINTVKHLCLQLGISEAELGYLYDHMPDNVRRVYRTTAPGKTREIFKPSAKLLKVQKAMNTNLLQRIKLPDPVHGSRKGRSHLTGAALHVGKEVIASLDIKNFFPSIHYKRVYNLFRELGCAPDIARILTRLTTFENRLPQGFATSSSIANLILSTLDSRLESLCAAHRLTYTRYVDDIVVSGNYRVEDLGRLFVKIVKESGFSVQPDKIRIMRKGTRQEVTRVLVNRKLNVPREEIRELRAILHNCQVYGPSSQTEMSLEWFQQHLRGRINYIIQVNPSIGNQLLEQYNRINWPESAEQVICSHSVQ